MMAKAKQINFELWRTDIGLYLTHDEAKVLHKKMGQTEAMGLHQERKFLTRIFNENFESGGKYPVMFMFTGSPYKGNGDPDRAQKEYDEQCAIFGIRERDKFSYWHNFPKNEYSSFGCMHDDLCVKEQNHGLRNLRYELSEPEKESPAGQEFYPEDYQDQHKQCPGLFQSWLIDQAGKAQNF